MHQEQSPLWLNLTFLVTAIALVVVYFRARRRKVPVPRRPALVLWVLAVAQLVFMQGCEAWGRWSMRRSVAAVQPAAVSVIAVSRGTVHRDISDPVVVSNLVTSLQSMRGVAAHHSYPMNPADITFVFHRAPYHFRVGRDSARPDEFWVKPVDPASGYEGTEMGRIRSLTFGAFLDGLLSTNAVVSPK